MTAVLPNGCTVQRAREVLGDYDMRKQYGYKNQAIAARQRVKFVTAMNVRDLRKWLDALDSDSVSSPTA